MTSGFCCSVNENLALLGLYAASQHRWVHSYWHFATPYLQHRLVGSYWHFATTYLSQLKRSHTKDYLTIADGTDRLSVAKMSVTNYQSTLCNIPEEQRYQADYLCQSSTKIKPYLQSTTHFHSMVMTKAQGWLHLSLHETVPLCNYKCLLQSAGTHHGQNKC
jgi:hypothetical protein